jgi:hypothetical protein
MFLPYCSYLFTIQLAFLPYCPYLIAIRLVFLPYFPYHFSFQLTFFHIFHIISDVIFLHFFLTIVVVQNIPLHEKLEDIKGIRVGKLNGIGFFIITLRVLWRQHVRGLISTWLFWGPVGHHNLGKVCYRKWRHRKSHDWTWRERRVIMKNPIPFWKPIIRFCFGNLYSVMYFM